MGDRAVVERGGGEIIPPEALALIRAELERDPRLVSPHTRRSYYGALGEFEAWRAGRPVTKRLVEAWAAELQAKGQAPATINHKLSAVRWWAKRLADMAQEDPSLSPEARREIAEQAARAASVSNVRGEKSPRGRHISEGEIRALLQECVEDGPAGVRDAALIALAFATGLRRGEIAALDMGDVKALDSGYELTIRRAKGGKFRTVSVYGGAAKYLKDWLEVRGERPGPLFLAITKGGRIQDHGLTTQSLMEMLYKRCQAAGIERVNWHDARRTLAGNLLDAGVDLALVQRILGHASPVTTSAYDRRPEEAKRKALKLVHVPYLRKRGER